MRDRRARIASAKRLWLPSRPPQQCRVLINIGRAGILPEGDTMDISRADVGAAREAIGSNRRDDCRGQGAAVAGRRRRE